MPTRPVKGLFGLITLLTYICNKMTISELISQVRSTNKQLYDDNLISDRYIFRIAYTKAKVLIKREINLRRLLNSDNLFTHLECTHLEKTTYTECGLSCTGFVRKSKKLPQLEEGIFGYILQGVYNIDNSEEIYPTTNREYINIKLLRQKSNKKNYIIKEQRVYVLDPYIENVNLYIYSPSTIFNLEGCQSAYEAEFKIPGYLEDSLYAMINQEILNYLNKPTDITDNNLDRN